MSQDIRLQEAVLEELNWEPSVAAAHIGVTANAGIITLTGHVESFAEKYAAEKATRRVRGVKAIAEEIEVKLPFDSQRRDDEIAEAVIDRLAWDTFIPDDSVKATVQDGWVTLTGQLEWGYQREAAEQNVRRLSGVVGVSNQTTIKAKSEAKNIGNRIMQALHRSWFLDPDAVKVSVDGGEILLTGTVHSQTDRNLATMAAWAAPGTTFVENDIEVVEEITAMEITC